MYVKKKKEIYKEEKYTENNVRVGYSKLWLWLMRELAAVAITWLCMRLKPCTGHVTLTAASIIITIIIIVFIIIIIIITTTTTTTLFYLLFIFNFLLSLSSLFVRIFL